MQGFPGGASGKEPTCQCRRHKRWGFNPWVRKIPWRRSVATHSTILGWRTPWTEEPGRLQSLGLPGVGHSWTTQHESESDQSCLTLCDPMDCSPPGSSIRGIFHARELEWVAISFSRGSFWSRDQTPVARMAGRTFYPLSHQGRPHIN